MARINKTSRYAALGLAGLLTVGVVAAVATSAGPAAVAATPPAPAEVATVPIKSGEYVLGASTLVQQNLPVGNPRREMPVRLNGYIAAPDAEGEHPVVLMLHGMHPGCPTSESGVDTWPCSVGEEQPNYRGFAYLADEIAKRGYVAMSINLNAEYTLGYGEAAPGTRLEQLVDQHLDALRVAADGGDNDFGIELAGRVDPDRMVLVGHSRGGESAVELAKSWQPSAAGADTAGPSIDGLLLLAPAAVFHQPEGRVPAPTAVILPACDADVREHDGQGFLEASRLVEGENWITSAWLEGANHNNVNSVLAPDAFTLDGRPDCGQPLDPQAQRDFTAQYAVDFLTTLYSDDADEVAAARYDLGIHTGTPVRWELYGLPAHAALVNADSVRLPLVPAIDPALVSGGASLATDGLAINFCPAGYYTPEMNPDAAGCRRAQVNVPGNPAHLIASWQHPGAELNVALPGGSRDLSAMSALGVRVAVDPLDPANEAGASQGFSVRLTDGAGRSASVTIPADAPALRYPAGVAEPDEYFPGDRFTGPVTLMPLRVPLASFAGVDLSDIRQVALVFDQSDSGALYLADLEIARS